MTRPLPRSERTEWVFDRDALGLLGTRTVLMEDNDWGKRGEAVEARALVARGIADRPGTRPER